VVVLGHPDDLNGAGLHPITDVVDVVCGPDLEQIALAGLAPVWGAGLARFGQPGGPLDLTLCLDRPLVMAQAGPGIDTGPGNGKAQASLGWDRDGQENEKTRRVGLILRVLTKPQKEVVQPKGPRRQTDADGWRGFLRRRSVEATLQRRALERGERSISTEPW
jgi:hypothetical protein